MNLFHGLILALLLQFTIPQRTGVAVSSFPTPLENWKSQEGSGTTLNNSGTDSTNSATTNVAWSSATGFTGTVATYNGTSSVSNASSSTNTNFDGTLPFSGCAWVNMTLPGSGDVVIVSDVTTATGNAGYSFRVLSGGQLELYLVNNISTNLILVHQDGSATPKVVTGSLTFVCFTYDGSKTAAGVKMYVNGASVLVDTVTNTLTGSIASATPARIGAEAGGGNWITGAVGRVRIWTSVLSAPTILALATAGPNAQ